MAGPSYVRAPHVVAHWRLGTIIFVNYAARSTLYAGRAEAEVADACSIAMDLDDLQAELPHYSRAGIRNAVKRLTRKRILLDSTGPITASDSAHDSLTDWNPAFGFFHAVTKDVAYGAPSAAEAELGRRNRGRPEPRAVRRLPGSPTVLLPGVDDTGRLAQVLLERRTHRNFGRAPVAMNTVASLLGLTAGITGWLTARGRRKVPLRTSPSGGARQPIDVYLVSYRVTGLDRGIYYYDAQKHVLRGVRRLPKDGVDHFLPQQPWFADAAALVLFTASFERAAWRYHYPRAYRSVLLEAGHMCQSFCLLATDRGLASFQTAALADSVVERTLGLNGVSESVLYAAGIGSRTEGTGAPGVPGGARPMRIERNDTLFTRRGSR